MLTPVVFDDSQKSTIAKKIKEPDFDHENWSDEDLEPIKETVKKHYHSIQNTVCPYCRQKLNSKHGRYWDIEHIIPRSHQPNFMFEPLNLCLSCVDCNKEKSDKKVTTSNAKNNYPKKPSQYLIVHPHFDNYDDYLIAVKPGLFYYPLESKGRKTIEVCGLNRFYEFAGFGESEDVFTKINRLTELAKSESCENIRQEILGKITALALEGLVTSKRQG
ncbi:HNH endonuclease [Vibrio antiquarius]|uniref:HNH endonuclease n=1 Tax=Vibrio antiquarius (strain Ex25) TaxID=150340 RepID=UPI002657F598|nr:HNH endonuclease [Vibrio antiquarius]MCS0024059.1 HNH endonuclease [Vibrio antiquarius]